jgi:hypothetical protein
VRLTNGLRGCAPRGAVGPHRPAPPGPPVTGERTGATPASRGGRPGGRGRCRSRGSVSPTATRSKLPVTCRRVACRIRKLPEQGRPRIGEPPPLGAASVLATGPHLCRDHSGWPLALDPYGRLHVHGSSGLPPETVSAKLTRAPAARNRTRTSSPSAGGVFQASSATFAFPETERPGPSRRRTAPPRVDLPDHEPGRVDQPGLALTGLEQGPGLLSEGGGHPEDPGLPLGAVDIGDPPVVRREGGGVGAP